MHGVEWTMAYASKIHSISMCNKDNEQFFFPEYHHFDRFLEIVLAVNFHDIAIAEYWVQTTVRGIYLCISIFFSTSSSGLPLLLLLAMLFHSLFTYLLKKTRKSSNHQHIVCTEHTFRLPHIFRPPIHKLHIEINKLRNPIMPYP